MAIIDEANLEDGQEVPIETRRTLNQHINEVLLPRVEEVSGSRTYSVPRDVFYSDIASAHRAKGHTKDRYEDEDYVVVSAMRRNVKLYVITIEEAIERGRNLTKKDQRILLKGLEKTADWCNQGQVFPKVFSEEYILGVIALIDDEDRTKITPADLKRAAEKLRDTVSELTKRLDEIKGIVPHIEEKGTTIYVEMRDRKCKADASRVKEVLEQIKASGADVTKADFDEPLEILTELKEEYFQGTKHIGLGYKHAEPILNRLISMLNGLKKNAKHAGREKSSYHHTLNQAIEDIQEFKADIEHKYSYKVTIILSNKKKVVKYRGLGVTVGSLLGSLKGDKPARDAVNAWIDSRKASRNEILQEKLKDNAKIKDPRKLVKSTDDEEFRDKGPGSLPRATPEEAANGRRILGAVLDKEEGHVWTPEDLEPLKRGLVVGEHGSIDMIVRPGFYYKISTRVPGGGKVVLGDVELKDGAPVLTFHIKISGEPPLAGHIFNVEDRHFKIGPERKKINGRPGGTEAEIEVFKLQDIDSFNPGSTSIPTPEEIQENRRILGAMLDKPADHVWTPEDLEPLKSGMVVSDHDNINLIIRSGFYHTVITGLRGTEKIILKDAQLRDGAPVLTFEQTKLKHHVEPGQSPTAEKRYSIGPERLTKNGAGKEGGNKIEIFKIQSIDPVSPEEAIRGNRRILGAVLDKEEGHVWTSEDLEPLKSGLEVGTLLSELNLIIRPGFSYKVPMEMKGSGKVILKNAELIDGKPVLTFQFIREHPRSEKLVPDKRFRIGPERKTIEKGAEEIEIFTLQDMDREEPVVDRKDRIVDLLTKEEGFDWKTLDLSLYENLPLGHTHATGTMRYTIKKYVHYAIQVPGCVGPEWDIMLKGIEIENGTPLLTLELTNRYRKNNIITRKFKVGPSRTRVESVAWQATGTEVYELLPLVSARVVEAYGYVAAAPGREVRLEDMDEDGIDILFLVNYHIGAIKKVFPAPGGGAIGRTINLPGRIENFEAITIRKDDENRIELFVEYKDKQGDEKKVTLKWVNGKFRSAEEIQDVIVREDELSNATYRVRGPGTSGYLEGSVLNTKMGKYIDANKKFLMEMIWDKKDPILLQVPVEILDAIGEENARRFISSLQGATSDNKTNVVIEPIFGSRKTTIYYDPYEKFGIEKREFPESKKNRQHRITLFFPDQLGDVSDMILYETVDLGRNPIPIKDTIWMPVGFYDEGQDTSGLLRSIILGMRLMKLARDGGTRTKESEVFLEATVQQFISLCQNGEDIDKYTVMTALVNIALSNNKNGIIGSLRKIVELLPLTPIDIEKRREMYEYASDAIDLAA